MQLKKINSAKIEEKFRKPGEVAAPQTVTGRGTFPKYDEYERTPGKKSND